MQKKSRTKPSTYEFEGYFFLIQNTLIPHTGAAFAEQGCCIPGWQRGAELQKSSIRLRFKQICVRASMKWVIGMVASFPHEFYQMSNVSVTSRCVSAGFWRLGVCGYFSLALRSLPLPYKLMYLYLTRSRAVSKTWFLPLLFIKGDYKSKQNDRSGFMVGKLEQNEA